MKTILYIYPKCTTCQRALKFIEEEKDLIEVKDISKTPPTIDELKKMLVFYKGDIKKLFNTSGLVYKEMGLKNKLSEMSPEDALNLLKSNGMLVKRPFLISKDKGLVGFKENEWRDVK